MYLSVFLGFLAAVVGSLFEPPRIEALVYTLFVFSFFEAMMIIFWVKGVE